jgi:hypothetical protein
LHQQEKLHLRLRKACDQPLGNEARKACQKDRTVETHNYGYSNSLLELVCTRLRQLSTTGMTTFTHVENSAKVLL